MEELKTIKAALDKATQKGSYTLDEISIILNAFQSVAITLQKLESQIKSLESIESGGMKEMVKLKSKN